MATLTFQCVAVWDLDGATKREGSGLLPASIIWGEPPQGAKENSTVSISRVRPAVAPLSATTKWLDGAYITRPAWKPDSKVLFGLSPNVWATPEEAENWTKSDTGKAWLAHCLGFTIIQLP
jgi:hypothetical protein